jgi:hypothetical protein
MLTWLDLAAAFFGFQNVGNRLGILEVFSQKLAAPGGTQIWFKDHAFGIGYGFHDLGLGLLGLEV